MNLDLDVFTYITGIAGLLGLVLQLKDAFPEHRETRKTIVLLVLGIFLEKKRGHSTFLIDLGDGARGGITEWCLRN